VDEATMALAMLLAWLWIRLTIAMRRAKRRSRRAHPVPVEFRASANQRKPDWVRREVIRLKAWSPKLGCRKIADAFNRRFAESKRMTVSKSFVAQVLATSRIEIARMRRTMKHRIPRPLPRNRIWALDLSTVTDLTTRQHLALGVIDHGTRACIALRALSDKRSFTILRELIAAMRRFGLPRCIRVDNEVCLTSRPMRFAMMLLGIRMQRTDTHCPWQNGYIERLFGTLKAALGGISVVDTNDWSRKLIEFRTWYNHARPHQHLELRTPSEAWSSRPRSMKPPWLIRVWDGELTGWYFPL
jgi:transposase InsO family protein